MKGFRPRKSVDRPHRSTRKNQVVGEGDRVENKGKKEKDRKGSFAQTMTYQVSEKIVLKREKRREKKGGAAGRIFRDDPGKGR